MYGVGTYTGIDEQPIFIINNHGNGDTVREGGVICTPWSYPSTLHALTVINISNQSPRWFNTFRWTGEMQNWALTQAPGTPEARPQRPKRPRGAQEQPNPDAQKQMLLILSRLALRHDLEIRELQAATFRTMLVKHDEPLFGAGEQSGHGTLRDQVEGGTTANGRAARLRMGCHDDGFDHEPSTLLGRQAESGGIHVQCEFTGDSSAEHLLEPVQKNISERLGQVAVFRGPPDSAHFVPHHQCHESEVAPKKSSATLQRGGARTPTKARRSITQAGDKKGGQQLLTSWIRPKRPSTARSSTEDSRGGQWLLTSWMRSKSSPAPAVYAAVLVVEYISPTPEVCAATFPVVENIFPAPAATYAETVPVMEYISPAPAGYTAPAALVEYVCPAPAVSIAEPAPAVCAAHDAVVEYISSATAMSLAAPTPVHYATLVKHAAPEQYDAPMMTVNGVDLNRDGISDVLQQPQVGIRRLSNTEHLSSMQDQ